VTWNKADICERCKEPRKDHMPDKSSGRKKGDATVAVTCANLSSCTAFIEPGEPVPSLTETLPPRSLEFFNERWNELHGGDTKLYGGAGAKVRRPHFASGVNSTTGETAA
jgi:hypothetical protein